MHEHTVSGKGYSGAFVQSQREGIIEMKTTNISFRRYLFIWGTILFLTGCGLVAMVQSNQVSETEEGRVNIAAKSKMESKGIPLIDQSVKPIIETASFGLG